MDVLAELLPPSYLVKAENTAKDKKQNSKHSRQQLNQGEQAIAAEDLDVQSAVNWDHVDRRSGEDRRQNSKCRGRWLESRAEKDRRQQAKAIAIKI